MVYTTAFLFGHGVAVMSEKGNVMDMMGKFFAQLTSPGQKTKSIRWGSVESCDEPDNSSPFENLDAGVDYEERQDMAQQIERCLTEAKGSTLHCQVLLLPRHMTSRVGQDVMQSSADEPCGLRGASIKVYVDAKDGLKSVGSIFPDPSITSTFELSVIFKAEKNDGWLTLQHIFDTTKVLKLRPEYRLVKRKLYSSASPVIHDFN
ncbi:DNA damage-inducible transcript 4-like protein [Cheilinus undulatus]|uniref:DNA damage-inducible transcript 4-like protein n=1 Tax=Cheilinus undulatus TaxID=241271 RepID=UPI001BD63B1C|nr:DNA damage-inducible transcript 4-like protein [Cheilinus undulatus]